MRGVCVQETLPALPALLVPTSRGWLRAWVSSPEGWPNILGKWAYLIGSLSCRKSGPDGEVMRTQPGTGSAKCCLGSVPEPGVLYLGGLGTSQVGFCPVIWWSLIKHPLFARWHSASVVNTMGFRTLRPRMVSKCMHETHSFVHSFMQHIIIDHLLSTPRDTIMNKTEWAMPSWEIQTVGRCTNKCKITQCVKQEGKELGFMREKRVERKWNSA